MSQGAAPGPVEPDYRFTLANERTFLAWVRTGLALVAAGAAVVHLAPAPAAGSFVIGLALVVLGGVVEATAYRTWSRNDDDIRHGRPLRVSRVPRLVAVCLVLLTAAVLVVTAALGPG